MGSGRLFLTDPTSAGIDLTGVGLRHLGGQFGRTSQAAQDGAGAVVTMEKLVDSALPSAFHTS
jgi:hypothetical protein